MRIGVIDVGTNSVKLDIATLAGKQISHELHRSEVTKLGEGLARGRSLKPAAMRRTIRAIRRWAGLCRRRKCGRVLAIGTHALREASNARMFLTACRRETGVAIKIITGRREAELSFRGVTLGIGGDAAVIDVGGGSTELTAGRKGRVAVSTSLHLGALALTERFLKSDPPTRSQLDKARAEIQRRLESLTRAQTAALSAVTGPVAVGGTAVTLARIAGVPEAKLQGGRLDRADFERRLSALARMKSADRTRRHGIEPGRADIVVAGGLILLGAMDRFGWTALRLSLRGLRTGLMMEETA